MTPKRSLQHARLRRPNLVARCVDELASVPVLMHRLTKRIATLTFPCPSANYVVST